jgi:hypothetical protein
MSVLIDTSVWVDHFRRGNDVLVGLMVLGFVCSFPTLRGGGITLSMVRQYLELF